MRLKLFARTLPLLAAGALLSLPLLAQDQSTSVADAARRAREQKKNAQKPATVITDDTLKPAVSNVQLGTVSTSSGEASAAPSESGNAAVANQPAAENAAANAPATPATEDQDEKKHQIESLNAQIDEKQHDVDLSQREFNLDNDSFYAKPNYQDDRDGKARLDQQKADLNAKKEELAQLKSKLAELGGTYEPKPTAPPTRKYVQVP